MSEHTVPSTDTARTTCRVDQLRAGDRIFLPEDFNNDPVVRTVTHAQPLPHSVQVLVVLDDGDVWRPVAEQLLHLATDADIERSDAAARREAVAEALGELAQLIEDKALPLDGYRVEVRISVESRADVDVWAEALDAEVSMGGTAANIPIAESTRHVDGPYGLRFDVHVQGNAERVETPAESTEIVDANLRAMGSAGLPEDAAVQRVLNEASS